MIRYHKVVGVDIGTVGIRAVLAARRLGEPVLLDSAHCELPESPASVGKTVRRLLDAKGWGNIPCVLGLPGDRVVLRSLPVDLDDPRTESQIAHFEAEPYFNAGENGTIMAHHRMRDGDATRLLFTITRSDTVEDALQQTMHEGILVVGMVPNTVALYNAVLQSEAAENEPFVAVELGRQSCELIVGTRRALLFARRFENGMPMPARRSESGNDTQADYDASLQTCAEVWSEKIHEHLSLYSADEDASEPPRCVVLSGPGAALPGMEERLEAVTGLATSSWTHCGSKVSKQAGATAVAAGLALARVDSSALALSLLPPEQREATTLRWQMRYWALSAGCLLGAVLLVWLAARFSVGKLSAQIEARRTTLEEYQKLDEKTDRLRATNLALRKEVAPLRIAVHNGRAVRGVIDAVAQAKHADDWIILFADGATYFADGEAQPEAASPAIEQVVLEGYTPQDKLTQLLGMIEALQLHPAVAGADLLPDDKVRVDPERDARWADAASFLFAIQIIPAGLPGEDLSGEAPAGPATGRPPGPGDRRP
jgi:Tfp pilus assembly PilM family ATPase